MGIPVPKDYGINCPQCGARAFPTNFPPSAFGGKKNDKRTVWLCSDMGHCAFAIGLEDSGCEACNKLSGKQLCLECRIAQKDWEVTKAMRELEELKNQKEKQNAKGACGRY